MGPLVFKEEEWRRVVMELSQVCDTDTLCTARDMKFVWARVGAARSGSQSRLLRMNAILDVRSFRFVRLGRVRRELK